MTYNEAYNKIIEAYFKNEIEPYDPKFCFCGTLATDHRWPKTLLAPDNYLFRYKYSLHEFGRMEDALLTPLGAWVIQIGEQCSIGITKGDNDYEEKLFLGMSTALDVLKEIHRSRGENVDDVQVFSKRVLA